MSQYRGQQGPPPNPPVQMMKDREMGKHFIEAAAVRNRSREDQIAYDELGRPLNWFLRLFRWMRKIFKGY